jgi:hypothetical protein
VIVEFLSDFPVSGWFTRTRQCVKRRRHNSISSDRHTAN